MHQAFICFTHAISVHCNATGTCSGPFPVRWNSCDVDVSLRLAVLDRLDCIFDVHTSFLAQGVA